jgi:hypothetical protein
MRHLEIVDRCARIELDHTTVPAASACHIESNLDFLRAATFITPNDQV